LASSWFLLVKTGARDHLTVANPYILLVKNVGRKRRWPIGRGLISQTTTLYCMAEKNNWAA
jgi:hypothetical protein